MYKPQLEGKMGPGKVTGIAVLIIALCVVVAYWASGAGLSFNGTKVIVIFGFVVAIGVVLKAAMKTLV